MKTITILERDDLVKEGALVAVGGLVFLLFVGGLASHWLVGLGLAALIWLFGLYYLGQQYVAVHLHQDGTVQFVRLWASVRVAATDIRTIEGKLCRDEDGDFFWRIRVHYGKKRLDLGLFDGFDDLLEELKARNPAIVSIGQLPPSALSGGSV